MKDNTGCPFSAKGAQASAAGNKARSNKEWWPNMLNLNVLRLHSKMVDPMGETFNYQEEFKTLDLEALKKDLTDLMTDTKEWWPADYGHYGPLFIRMAWHVAGTYRTADGRGGAGQGLQRFAPTNSWPDNTNLDKARRLLWPLKQKYGRKISWSDLFILAGNIAHESMGFKTFGFGGGREDVYQAAEDIYWGMEDEWLGNKERYSESTASERVLEQPLAAVHMGLIYVNPEGPNGNPDPLESAKDIRETFGRMAMNAEETVALIAGGHTFGKAHGAAPDSHVGVEPNGSDIENQGFGWNSTYESGKGRHTITSGIEGSWTSDPTNWDTGYFDVLLGYDWELVKSPAGANQWHPVNLAEEHMAPQVDTTDEKVTTMMTTADMALREDPIFAPISKKFHEDHEAFKDAYARAWFKLTHRDMGPINRYLGADVPSENLIWQDPLPSWDQALISDAQIADLKGKIQESGLSVADMVWIAWASASSYRNSDRRGGANGARIRLAPQKDWPVNEPARLKRILGVLEGIQSASAAPVSLADLIVLAGSAGIEKAAQAAGSKITVPFTPGRVDATDAHTDADSFDPMEPETEGFRNFAKDVYTVSAEELLVDKAQLLDLSAPEMTVLVGGLRSLGITDSDNAKLGVLTDRAGTLSNDFFVNLMSMDTAWKKADGETERFIGMDRASGTVKWHASRVDLIFGHNAELRAISEVYGADDAQEKFTEDFIAAWVKVMELDRFDLMAEYQ